MHCCQVCKNCLYIICLILVSCTNSSNELIIDINSNTQKPQLFAEGIISTPYYERDIAISPSGNEIIYTLSDYKQNKRVLVQLRKKNGKWLPPRVLPFSGIYSDIEPFISHDGRQLFFASNRPMPNDTSRNDYNIWVMQKVEDKWAKPAALDTIINSNTNEFYPSVSSNGNLYFTTSRKDGYGREDIFISEFTSGKYQQPYALDTTINSPFFEFNAYINPNEDLIVFSSFGRKDGMGGGDLYYSKKDSSGKWQKAKNMGKLINSEYLDYCPFIDYNGNNFYFTSDRPGIIPDSITNTKQIKELANNTLNGFGNIYVISTHLIEW